MSYEIVIVVPTTFIATLACVYLVLKYWDTLEKIYSIILRIILFFKVGAQSIQRSFVASDIQGRINEFVSEYAKGETSDIIPHRLKIEWTKESTREEFLRRGELVLRMKYHEDQDKNFVIATVAFFNKCLIPRARHYVDKLVLKSTELFLSKKVLTQNRLHSATNYFLEYILDPELSRDNTLRGTISSVESVDEHGWLNRILLREYTEMAKLIYPSVAPRDVLEETCKFLEFLNRIATKEQAEDVELDFKGRYIRMGIIFVARPDVISEHGLRPYLARIKRQHEQNLDNIYVIATGSYNVNAVEVMSKLVIKDPFLGTRFEKAFEEKYPVRYKWDESGEGKTVKTICIGLRNKTKRPLMKLD